MPKLLLKFNAAVIKEIPLDKATIMVGRKPDNDIVIDNPAISGHHCKVVAAGGAFFVEDLESTNGTFVNEKRVMKAGLHHNDVIGLARHSIVFADDVPAPAAEPPEKEAPAEPEGTMVLPPEQAEQMAKASVAASPKGEPARAGWVRVLKNGGGGETEFELKGLSTYIGKSDRVQIPIKSAGFFSPAPEVAASIHRKPEGYVLVAVKEGFPVVNGEAVTGQVPLPDGAIIECGSTTLQFFLK